MADITNGGSLLKQPELNFSGYGMPAYAQSGFTGYNLGSLQNVGNGGLATNFMQSQGYTPSMGVVQRAGNIGAKAVNNIGAGNNNSWLSSPGLQLGLGALQAVGGVLGGLSAMQSASAQADNAKKQYQLGLQALEDQKYANAKNWNAQAKAYNEALSDKYRSRSSFEGQNYDEELASKKINETY